MKPLMPLKNRVGGVKGRLDQLAELGPRAGFLFDRFCDYAESAYYWFARIPRKMRALAQQRNSQKHDENMTANGQRVRRCPMRKFKFTQRVLDATISTIRWFHAHPSAQATLVSLIALGGLVIVHGAMGLSDGLTMAYVVPIWLATRLGGPLSGLLSVVFTTVAMNHADSLRGTLESGYGHTTIVRLSTLTVIMFFISHIEMRLQRAERMAATDSLTGLMNRAAVAEFAEKEIEEALSSKTGVTVVAIDCDKFKVLNDSYGHAFGDMALRTLARKLEASIGDKGVVARLGGDEFVAVLLNVDEETAHRLLQRGSDKYLRHMSYFGWNRTMSYGIAQLETDGRDFEALLRKADARLYESKRLGGQLEAVPNDQYCMQ